MTTPTPFYKTYGTITKEKQNWILRDVEPFVKIDLKALFRGIKKSNTDNFIFKVNEENAFNLRWFFQRYPFNHANEVYEELNQLADDFIQIQNTKHEIIQGNYQPIEAQFINNHAPRKYQELAVVLLQTSKTLLLSDSVGLGKTICAILAAVQPGNLPMLVVCQTHLPFQWEKMIHQFTNLHTHKILKGKPYTLPPADVYITKYTMLAKWVDIFVAMNIKLLTFDEGQELRRSESLKYEAAKAIADSSEKRLLLSATPIYNFADEIYNVMKIVHPGLLASSNEFSREWCHQYSNRVKDPKALGTFLANSGHFLRRTKKDVGMELDPVNKIVHTVGTDQKEIDKIEKRTRMLARTLLNEASSFIQRGQAARDLDIMMRKATGVGKAKDVAAYARIFLENNTPIVLVGWHRQVYDIWLRELEEFKPVMYTGSESPKQKNDAIEAFTKGQTNLFILSLRSGIGIDGLQHRCSTILLGELDWSPKVHEQLIGRLDRDGQTDPVTAVFLVSDEGSDPVIMDLLGEKKSESDAVMDPFKTTELNVSDSSRIKELAKALLSK